MGSRSLLTEVVGVDVVTAWLRTLCSDCDVSLGDGGWRVAKTVAGVIHIPELAATLWAESKVVVKELHGCAAVVAGHRFLIEDVDNGNIHNRKCGEGVCYLRYTPWSRWTYARQPPCSAKFNHEQFV